MMAPQLIGIDPDYDFLYDPQQAPHFGFCERCGREVYRYGDVLCWRCMEDDGYGDEA